MDQEQPDIHSAVLDGIARLSNPHHRNESHCLVVDATMTQKYVSRPYNRHSLEYLVNFLNNNNSHQERVLVTELDLISVELVGSSGDPSRLSDGGLDVLRSFFSRSDTKLTKVKLVDCDFGSREDTSQLIGAFQTNTTVSDSTIRAIRNLKGAALGNSLSGLMQNMPQLQRLVIYHCPLFMVGVRAFQSALQANRTLTELNLWSCNIRDNGIRVIADALAAGNTIEILDIGGNNHKDRILESTTHLKQINLKANIGIFNDEASTQRFARVLARHELLVELNISCCELQDDGIHLIADSLVENTTIEVLDIGHNRITSIGLPDITRLLQSMQLKTIFLNGNRGIFNDENKTLSFARVLSRHRFLKELNLFLCQLGDGNKIQIIADGLATNTIMERLYISFNDISPMGLNAITRMIESIQKLKKINFFGNHAIFSDIAVTEHFIATFQRKSSTVQDLHGIDSLEWPTAPTAIGAAWHATLNDSLTRNRNLNHVIGNLLSVPPPRQLHLPLLHNNVTASAVATTTTTTTITTAYLIKVWHKAVARLAMIPNNAGASAIFKLLQARPHFLEKRLKRPPPAAVAGQEASADKKRMRL